MTLVSQRLPGTAIIASMLCGWMAAAAPVQAQPVTVKDAWVRAPAPGQKVAAAYMELVSRGNSMVLIGVASPVAGRVEVHGTTVEAGVMKMRPAGNVELPAGKPVKLAPGGLHVMLMDLKQPLKPGDKVPLALTVQRADLTSRSVFAVQAEVRAVAEATVHHH